MWMDWKRNPVTQQFLTDIMTTREGKKEDIADGKVVEQFELFIEIGRTQGIKDCFEYAVREFKFMEIDSDHGTESGSV